MSKCSWLMLMLVCGSVSWAQNPLPDHFEIESDAKNYRLKFEAVSAKTTGTISLVDEKTSAILVSMDIVPGKLRAKPRALWREDSSDVAIELDTYNACSPLYILFHAKNKGYVGLSHGVLGGLSGYLGIDARQIVRARYAPSQWMGSHGKDAQIISVSEQCWDKRNQRYSTGDSILINADGELCYR